MVESKWFPTPALEDGSIATFGRTCRACAEWKPATAYKLAERTGGRVYLATVCKSCKQLGNRGREARVLVCANPECGRTFVTDTWNGEHCTSRCKKVSMRRRRGQKPQLAPIPESKPCKRCGETKPIGEFPLKTLPSGLARPHARCGECVREVDRQRRPKKAQPIPCAWCGEEFTPKTANGLYHTPYCRGAAMRARSKAVHAQPVEPDDGLKACRTCEKRKPLDAFSNKDRAKRVKAPDCKVCETNARAKAKIRARLGLPPDAPVRRGQEPKPEGYARVDQHGYVHEKRTGHHRANKNGFVGQHILAFEDHYGIRVPRGYTVHHKDDDRSNNHWSNLELRVGQHGKHGNVVPTLLRHEEYLIETLETLANNPAYLARTLDMLRNLGLIPA